MTRRGIIGLAALVAVLAVVAFGGREVSRLVGTVGLLGFGLFAATSIVSLFAYRNRKDPALLLVGVGTAAYALHRVLIDGLMGFTTWGSMPWWDDLTIYAAVAGPLVLAANLVMVVPWVDRRGRPPLAPRTVVLATALGLTALDVLAAIWGSRTPSSIPTADGLPVLLWLEAGALTLVGIVVLVRCGRWAGRFAWIAAAGLALSVFGAMILLSASADAERVLRAASTTASIAPTLAAGSLLAFVLASLEMESSRMRRASDRAEEVLIGRAEIAAMVAHDIRGPLGTMRGLATTVRTSYERLGEEERLEFIGMIERESTRLLGAVEHIAVALRVDARTLDLRLRSQPLAPIIRQVLEAHDLRPHPVDADVPDGVVAPADAKWLPVAIGEALDNAARYSPPDAPITVRLRSGADLALIEIEDRGPGVPPERRDQMFERFARWRPPGYEDRPGSGLGLFICRGIVREHGGEASILDGPEGGTILRIELPLEETGSG